MSPKLKALVDEYKDDLGRICARLAAAERELAVMRPVVETAELYCVGKSSIAAVVTAVDTYQKTKGGQKP